MKFIPEFIGVLALSIIACIVVHVIQVRKSADDATTVPFSKWSIVHLSNDWGYVHFDGTIHNGFTNFESAQAAMRAKREWSDRFDADWKYLHDPGWKAVKENP